MVKNLSFSSSMEELIGCCICIWCQHWEKRTILGRHIWKICSSKNLGIAGNDGCWDELTCFRTVTAVVPLQKQSIPGCARSSLSMILYAVKCDSFHGWNIGCSFAIPSCHPLSVASSSLCACSPFIPEVPFCCPLPLEFTVSPTLPCSCSSLWANSSSQ